MKISVVIPAYNVEKFISQTLSSVMGQTLPVHEVILVDDGSKDRTAEIAEGFGAPVRVIRQKNAGASVARNKALDNVTGDFVAFLDADDLWEPTKLEKQLAFLVEHPEVGTVGASFIVFGDTIPTREVHMNCKRLLAFGPVDYLSSPRVHPSTLLCRREVMREIRFPDGIGDVEDVIYACLLRTKAKIGAIGELLMRRREHPGQVTKTTRHYGRGLQARIKWARENYHLLQLESPDVALDRMLQGAVEDVSSFYWTRDLISYRHMRAQLIDVWPKDRPLPNELNRSVPPLFLLKLKDAIDKWRQAS